MQKSRVRYGTLSSDEFNVAARALSDRWKQIDSARPQWDWIPCSRIINGDSCLNAQNEGYLSMEGVHICHSDKILSDKDETHVYDYHIVYSFSYRVPVLYFRGYQSGGQPLNLDDIQKDLPCYSLSILRDSKWTFMTQEEHPYLHRPWYTLHPCGTSEWMKLLLSGTQPTDDSKIAAYLLAWLSVAGQAVGLKIPLELHSIPLQMDKLSSLDFEALTPTDSNYLNWKIDVVLALRAYSLYETLVLINEPSMDMKAKTLMLLRKHIYPMLKNEYLIVGCPVELWK